MGKLKNVNDAYYIPRTKRMDADKACFIVVLTQQKRKVLFYVYMCE